MIVSCFFVFKLVSFINNDHIVFMIEQNIPMRITLGCIDGCYNNIVIPGVFFFLRNRRNSKFLVQFTDPLQYERGRNKNKRFTDETTKEIFLENKPRFYRLAQSDLICKNGAATHFEQHFSGGLGLMWKWCYALQMLHTLHFFKACN
ncbi:hypothetical protein D3C76_447050 [compost metagenome]